MVSNCSNRIILGILAVCVLAMVCFAVMADSDESDASVSFTKNGLSYTANNTSATLTGYTGSPSSIIIPDTVENAGITYEVNAIGPNAFKNCTTLTSLTIGPQVSTIGQYAFTGCSNLSTMYYNAVNASTTGSYHLHTDGSGSLSGFQVIIGNGVKTIPEYMFKNSNISSVTIPASITTIDDNAFYGCTRLTTLNWSDASSNATIGLSAFKGCTHLSTVTIPQNYTAIYSNAFENCTGLTSLTIGPQVSTIGQYAFTGCTDISTINYNAVNASTTGAYKLYTNGSGSLSGCNVIIGNGVKTIPAYLFKNSYISSITISATVDSIKDNAFTGCDRLTEIVYCVGSPLTFTAGSSDNGGIAKNATSITKKGLEVKFVDNAGKKIRDSYCEVVEQGDSKTVSLPEITGYTRDNPESSVTIVMDTICKEYTVTYTPKSYVLVINYEYKDGSVASEKYTAEVLFNEKFSVSSPSIDGYVADKKTVSGTMDQEGLTYTVVYSEESSSGGGGFCSMVIASAIAIVGAVMAFPLIGRFRP